MLRGKLGLARVEAQAGARRLESAAEHPGIGAAPGHALAEGGIEILAAAHLAQQRKDALLALRKIRGEPLRQRNKPLHAGIEDDDVGG